MGKKKKTPKEKTYCELLQTFRGDWGNVNPVTRVHKDKSKYNRKEKEDLPFATSWKNLYEEITRLCKKEMLF